MRSDGHHLPAPGGEVAPQHCVGQLPMWKGPGREWEMPVQAVATKAIS